MIFEGIYLENNKSKIIELISIAENYKYLMLGVFIFATLSSIASLAPYFYIYLVLEEVLKVAPSLASLNVANVTNYAWNALIYAVLGFVLYFIALMCSHLVAFKVEENLKSNILKHLIKLPMGFHTTNTSGKLRKIIEENSTQTEMFLAHQIPDFISSVVAIIAMLAFLLYFDWRLGLSSIVMIVIAFLIQKITMDQKSDKFLKEYQDSMEAMNNEAVEYVRGISVVKVFGQTIHSFKKFHKSIMNYKNFVIEYTLSWKIPMTLFTTVINGIFFILIPVGILLSRNTSNYLHFVLSFIFYVIFTPAIAVILMKILYLSSYKMIAEEAFVRSDSLTTEKPLKEPTNPKKPKDSSISFKNVKFSYPENEVLALDGVNLDIEAGTTVALIGPSGGGKTTIGNLIGRFWDVDSGDIEIGNVNIKNIPYDVLMSEIAFVFQDSKLFKTTLFENIVAGKENVSEEDVLKAAKAAQCDDIIEKLPNGIHTVISKKGVYLSGGEQQRIAIARAILKDAPIIILDEATAFADPENEYKIQKAFEKLTENKTVIMIAHRISTIENVDNIFVIDKGRVCEKGTHNNLLIKDGLYKSIWTKYQEAYSWKIARGE